MRIISAKFKSACKKCGGSIAEGLEIFYDDSTKRAFHTQCAPAEPAELFSSSESVQLADKLGFRPHDELSGGGSLR